MKRTVLRILTAIQLTRLTIAFGAISEIWFVLLLMWSEQPQPAEGLAHGMSLAPALLAGAVVATGLSAYGASFNDVLDVRHDMVFSPERPIPAGRIKVGQAAVVTVGALLLAILAASAFRGEALRVTLVAAAAILFYNAAGKYIPAIGIPTIGLIHALHMFIPDLGLGFTLPIWLVFSHTMLIALAVHVLEEKRPKITRRSAAAIAVAWLSWSGVILTLGLYRDSGFHFVPMGFLAPIAAIIGFLIVARWKTANVPRLVAAEKLKRYGAMWQCLYGASWFLAIGHLVAAMWLAIVAVVGFSAMTLLKELTGITNKPVRYRA